MFITELFEGFDVFTELINAPSFMLGHRNTSAPLNLTFLLTKIFIYNLDSNLISSNKDWDILLRLYR